MDFDNNRPGYSSSTGTSPAALAGYIFVAVLFAVFGGLMAYDRYQEYRAKQYLIEFNKETAAQLAAQRAARDREELKAYRKQSVSDAHSKKLELAQSVEGCAANQARTKCDCFDAQARIVPTISKELCLQAVDKGLRWFQHNYVNG
jgi:hypothetical protein